MKRALSTFMFVLLLVNTLTFAFNTQNVKASGTIYIRADGNIDPPDAPIRRDGDIYTFTADIYFNSLVVERDNIVVDGDYYMLQGTGSGNGVTLSGRNNVTIKNIEIKSFTNGIYLSQSSNGNIVGNDINKQWW